jgi:hypothetical protein
MDRLAGNPKLLPDRFIRADCFLQLYQFPLADF